MGLDTTATGKTTWHMDMDDLSTLMEISTLDIGRKTSHTAWASTSTKMGQSTKASGVRINTTDLGAKVGQMAPFTKEVIFKALKKAKEPFFGRMVAATPETSRQTIWRAWGFTAGKMAEFSTAHGKTIRCTEEASFLGKMADLLKASTSLTKNMAKEFSNGKYFQTF